MCGVRRRWTVAWVLGLSATACHAKFTGPYQCVPGYASCVQPDENRCETNTQTDSLNCGECSNGDSGVVTSCHLGAPCVDAGCGVGASQIATLQSGSQTPIVVNATGVFWTDGGNVYWLAPSGGVPTTVATGVLSCGQAASFAVDSTSVYYFSTGFDCAQSGSCAGLVRAPISGGMPTVLVPAAQSSSENECAALSLSADGSELYWLTSLMQGNTATLSLNRLSLAAGSNPTTLATAQSSNGSSSNRLVVTPTAAIFEVNQTNEQATFQVVPTSGASATTLPLPPNSQGFAEFTADSSNIYVVGSSCPCDNNNQGGTSMGLPVGTVGKVPIDGSAGTILTQFTGQAGDIAVDPGGSYVYWSTDTAAWGAPVTGGRSIPVAGNLTGGIPGVGCTGCGGGDNQYSIAIGVDASHIYLADHAANVNALLEVSK